MSAAGKRRKPQIFKRSLQLTSQWLTFAAASSAVAGELLQARKHSLSSQVSPSCSPGSTSTARLLSLVNPLIALVLDASLPLSRGCKLGGTIAYQSLHSPAGAITELCAASPASSLLSGLARLLVLLRRWLAPGAAAHPPPPARRPPCVGLRSEQRATTTDHQQPQPQPHHHCHLQPSSG